MYMLHMHHIPAVIQSFWIDADWQYYKVCEANHSDSGYLCTLHTLNFHVNFWASHNNRWQLINGTAAIQYGGSGIVGKWHVHPKIYISYAPHSIICLHCSQIYACFYFEEFIFVLFKWTAFHACKWTMQEPSENIPITFRCTLKNGFEEILGAFEWNEFN